MKYVGQRKINIIRSHLYVKSKNQNQNKTIQNWAYRYREQIGGCQGGEGWAKQVKGVKRYKPSIIKYISHGDVMYSMVIIVRNIILHIWKLKGIELTSSHCKKNSFSCIWWWMLARLIVMILLQYIQILNYYAIHLKIILYVNYIFKNFHFWYCWVALGNLHLWVISLVLEDCNIWDSGYLMYNAWKNK